MIGGSTGHPFLDFLTVALGLALGFLFVNDPRGPLAHLSVIARYSGFLAVAFFGIVVIGRALSFFAPLLSGSVGSVSVFDFFAGAILLAVLVAAYLILQGTVRVQLPRGMQIVGEGLAESGTGQLCTSCSWPVQSGAAFCSRCGTPTNQTGAVARN